MNCNSDKQKQLSELTNQLDAIVKNYLARHEKMQRISAFLDVAPSISNERFWYWFREVFRDCEFNLADSDRMRAILTTDRLVQHRFEFEPKAFEFICNAPDTITIYRGCDAESQHGWHWTPHREIAELFASAGYRKTNPGVLAGEVSKYDILYVGDAIYREFFVDPRTIRNKRVVSRVAAVA